MDNADDCKVNVSDSCRLDTPILCDYLDSPTYPLTPQDLTEFMAHHKIEDTSQNTAQGMDTAIAPPIKDEKVNDTSTSQTSLVPYIPPGQVKIDNESFLDSKVLIDLPDLGNLDEINVGSPGWKIIEPVRNRSCSSSKIKFSIQPMLESLGELKLVVPQDGEGEDQCLNYLKRILQDLTEGNAQVHGLRSEFTISEANYRANREAVAGLKETMEVRLKALSDKYKADRTLEKADEFRSSCSLEINSIKELLGSQRARLEAIESTNSYVIVEVPGSNGTITDADVDAGNAIPSSENLPIVIPNNSNLQPIDNVEQVNENLIACPPQSQNIQSSQPSTSRVHPSTSLINALRDISNNQRVSSVQILQNKKPKPPSTLPDTSKKETLRPSTRSRKSPARNEEGGRAKRARITLNQTTETGTANNGGRAKAKETCKKCFKLLDKYYLNKPNGHRKHCKPKVSS